jgi:hypothetical protein
VVVPDETGAIVRGRRGREFLEPGNLDEVLRAVGQCRGATIEPRSTRQWIRRSGDAVIDGRIVSVVNESYTFVSDHIRRVVRIAERGRQVVPPRGSARAPECREPIQCRAG